MLILFNKNENDAYFVVSNALIKEYISSSQNCEIPTSIPVIVDKLTREDRLNKISNGDIKKFQKLYFTKSVLKNLRSNKKDHQHIPIVFLSNRKIALTTDINFTYDLSHFTKHTCIVEDEPNKIDYKEIHI